jgi:hypothetical protein
VRRPLAEALIVLVILLGFRPGLYEWQDREGAWQPPVEVGEDGVLQFDPGGEITFTPDGNRQIRRVTGEGISFTCEAVSE